MKILRYIFNLIAAIIVLFGLFLILCAVNPSMGAKFKNFLDNSGITEKTNINGDFNFETPELLFFPIQTPEPEKIEVTVPSEVSNKSDYKKVEVKSETVSDSDAQNIENELDIGESGDGFDFSKTYYPFYHMLPANGKALYRQIYANANALKDSFSPVTDITPNEIYNAFEAVCNDHPELFWLDTAYSCKYTSDEKVVEIGLQFNKTADDLNTSKQLFDAVAEQILEGANGFSAAYDKELYIHDALARRIEYDARADLGQSAYSAMVGGRTVCAGYSRAFQYLCQKAEIPCYYVTGYSDQDHAWNIVMISDTFRNVDLTWDDADNINYDYFNITDLQIADSHVRTGLSKNLPACVDGTSIDSFLPSTLDLINPNPTEPLSLATASPAPSGGSDSENEFTGTAEELKRKIFIETNKLDEKDVVDTIEDYYNRCNEQMIAAGIGKKQFTLYIPQKMYEALQDAYGTGDYEEGYATSAMEKMGAYDFAIQLQMSNMDGGYIKVVHNVSTRKEEK